jgi:aminoglycoside 6'-N-acetyltransferase
MRSRLPRWIQHLGELGVADVPLALGSASARHINRMALQVSTNPEARIRAHERASDGFLSWRPLIAGDLPMLAGWLREPRVARWWNHETTLEGVERDFGASTRGEEPGEDLVVLLDGRPIGLLQRSEICDYPQDLAKFSAVIEVPVGAVELDYFIAYPALRGRGLGSCMIAAAVEDTWNSYPDAPAVLVAVVAANVASWRALEKAGLKRVAEGPMSPDNPIDDALHYIYRIDRPGADTYERIARAM